MTPSRIILWLPRGDEHELAASLGMVTPDAAEHERLIRAAQQQIAADQEGVAVSVYRWHIWRLIRTMAKLGLLNTPEGRAAAFAHLAGDRDSHDEA